jgi:hypothetical protein
MINGSRLAGCLPTSYQELLLKASLLQGEAAIDAWHKWKTQIDIERIDHDSHRLLPLLYHNLSRHNVQDQLLSMYKGAHRQAWYKNQIIFHCLAEVVRILRDEGIPTMILKGAALTLQYYKDFGLRPMDDFDILVPITQARQTINLLRKFNWQPKSPYKQMYSDTYFSFLHADIFEDSKGRLLDLHWHTMIESRDVHADDDFWEQAIPVKINEGSTAQALCPADQLLHIIVHGICWNPRPVPRWVTDAMMVLNSPAEIDWDRLTLQAKKRRLTLHLKNGLNYLRYLLDAPIPLTALEEIKIKPINNYERREWNWQNRSPKISAIFFVLWFRVSRFKEGGSFGERLIEFAKYLQFLWRVKHFWQLPFYFIFKSLRKILLYVVS